MVPKYVRFSFAVIIAFSTALFGMATTASSLPTGETIVGNAAIESAYNDATGNMIFILTPVKAPLPSYANSRATAPLYMVVYPPGTNFGTNFNCEGVPGNCPDHDGLAAGVATNAYPGVYGNDPAAVPGHDHLLDPPGAHMDFNVAWEAIEVVFTPKAVADNAITHITTEDQLDAAKADGYVKEIDLGFAFNCSVVPSRVYYRGTPVQ